MALITTNKTQPKPDESGKKLRILTTNDINLNRKRPSFKPRVFDDVDKRQTRDVDVGLLTAENFESIVDQELFVLIGTMDSGEVVGLYNPDWKKEPVWTGKKKKG